MHAGTESLVPRETISERQASHMVAIETPPQSEPFSGDSSGILLIASQQALSS